uniref:DUF406 family protein n=1 Tax=Thaumasiovibrio occultus TaxID=1891184 RepID=UPI000B362F09|nr:DUF406 family protein [Thaumasiovibrio occultus]
MSDQTTQYEACEACGVSAEMGFVIKEGDDVASVTITAPDQTAAQGELEKYLELAKEVNAAFTYQAADFAEGKLEVLVKFECSAEKLIFELRSRSI